MFYFKDILLRILYSCMLLISLFIILYLYKEIIINLVILPFIFFNKKTIKYFIYTHPTELFYSVSIFLLFLVLLIIIPYVLWSIIDFLKPGLYCSEKLLLKKIVKRITFFISFINASFLFFIFPLFWNFFESWNSFSNEIFKFYLELKLENYLNYLMNFIIIVNVGMILLILAYILILQCGILYFYNIKKMLILINILIATFISPPDVIFQIVLFFILNLIIESISYFFLLLIKINKALN